MPLSGAMRSRFVEGGVGQVGEVAQRTSRNRDAGRDSSSGAVGRRTKVTRGTRDERFVDYSYNERLRDRQS